MGHEHKSKYAQAFQHVKRWRKIKGKKQHKTTTTTTIKEKRAQNKGFMSLFHTELTEWVSTLFHNKMGLRFNLCIFRIVHLPLLFPFIRRLWLWCRSFIAILLPVTVVAYLGPKSNTERCDFVGSLSLSFLLLSVCIYLIVIFMVAYV